MDYSVAVARSAEYGSPCSATRYRGQDAGPTRLWIMEIIWFGAGFEFRGLQVISLKGVRFGSGSGYDPEVPSGRFR